MLINETICSHGCFRISVYKHRVAFIGLWNRYFQVDCDKVKNATEKEKSDRYLELVGLIICFIVQ